MPAIQAFHKLKWPASFVSIIPSLVWDIYSIVPLNCQVDGRPHSRYLLSVETDSMEKH